MFGSMCVGWIAWWGNVNFVEFRVGVGVWFSGGSYVVGEFDDLLEWGGLMLFCCTV